MFKSIQFSPLSLAALRAIVARVSARLAFACMVMALGIPLAVQAADPEVGDVVGMWRLEETSGLICNLEFRKDGVFVSDVSRKGKAVGDFAGKWALTGDKISYTYTKSNVKQIPIGSKDQDRVVELTPEHIDLQSDKGAVKRYTRVPPK